MPNHRLPKRVLFFMPNSEWRKQRGGQPLTWQRGMKEITKRLGAVGATRLPGWGPRDPYCAWLETLQDMAANRCQWRSCCRFLSRLPELSNKSWLYGSEASVLNTDVLLSMMMMMMMMMITKLKLTIVKRIKPSGRGAYFYLTTVSGTFTNSQIQGKNGKGKHHVHHFVALPLSLSKNAPQERIMRNESRKVSLTNGTRDFVISFVLRYQAKS
ncbi:hypothetical protein CSKR_109878 [Clonorchis sinensis]|uniref:Uncharacterized protein n=1 Tax=Clonorchis sinensis TaxID=79923 RepID=A0A419PNZ0_CLOSI|nr:hypothetical protein CSKR_109878 [Clonorchis sinensis]